jgi:hypothetical protein
MKTSYTPLDRENSGLSNDVSVCSYLLWVNFYLHQLCSYEDKVYNDGICLFIFVVANFLILVVSPS